MEEILIKQTLGTINYDFESTKNMLNEKLEEFRGALFTEDSKGIAKKTVASLRAEKKELEKRVREVKKEWLKPYESFEKDAKELISLYDEPIEFINGQVKEFEEKRIVEKQELIKNIYSELVISELIDFIPLSKIYNKKWENATCKEKEIREQIIEVSEKVFSEIATIKSMKSVDEAEALQRYKNNLDVLDTINFINERAKVRADAIERERKETEERQRREAEERARKEERERIASEQEKEIAEKQKEEELQAAKEQAKNEVVEDLTPNLDGETMFYDYTIILTSDAKEKLEMYMDSVGIDYIVK